MFAQTLNFLSPPLLYTDVDECNSTSLNNCSQVCVNTEGSYTCDCEAGYRLAADLITCEGTYTVKLHNYECNNYTVYV